MRIFVNPDHLRRLAKGAQDRSQRRHDHWDLLRDFVVRVSRRRVDGVLDLTRREAQQLQVLRQALRRCPACGWTGDQEASCCAACGDPRVQALGGPRSTTHAQPSVPQETRHGAT